ncbi:MAG: FAD-binding oxidoreductase [Kiritimatiellae bacterium]|nr:FAD-binding oxidoreductase [Kiritimatiellia bacterium]MDW8458319.1 FAD-binding oxidoreductase [Verrucomicrobiota bacterium]
MGRWLESADLEKVSPHARLMRGLGRSYGDSAVPASEQDLVVGTAPADRILSFDRRTGRLRAEAGLSLKALNDLFLREGWFVPVSPGTQYVTLGGMVASDVHGKNHHVAGTFGSHVLSLRMRLPDGRVIECGPDRESEIFWATVGGMGLTGHILEVEFPLVRVPTAWIWCESRRIPSLDGFLEGLRDAARRWPFTVGWVDCLARGRSMGRGILICGRWAEPDEARGRRLRQRGKITFPVDLPSSLLSPAAVRAMNEFIYQTHVPLERSRLTDPIKFFYPLDSILEWNRAYGPEGFTQYQCVLPVDDGGKGVRTFFETMTGLGGSSFLSVIKDCGAEGKGVLSFPKPGISIALDIPIRRGTGELVRTLNRKVIELGGRIYLTKDLFTTAEEFRDMEPRLERWLAVRRALDPEGRLRSAQSVRLFGDRP